MKAGPLERCTSIGATISATNFGLHGVALLSFAALTIAAAAPANSATTPKSAHELAEKFSRASGGEHVKTSADSVVDAKEATRAGGVNISTDSDARSEAEQLKAYEEELLERARAEAEASAKADLAREQSIAEQKAKAEKEKIARDMAAELAAAEEARRKADEAAQRAVAARVAAEQDRKARQAAEREKAAAREREARELAERLSNARRLREEARALAAAEAKARGGAQAATDNAPPSAGENATGKDTATVVETENSRPNVVQRPPAHALGGPTLTTPSRTPPASAHRPEPATRPAPVHWKPERPSAETESIDSSDMAKSDKTVHGHKATVLLIMQPGKRGIRRWNKSADPMLCIETSCFISNGPGMAARQLSKNKAFGPSVALGLRAGACRHSVTCVFRNVDLTADRAWLRPIDLRVLRHDRREARIISADPTCAVEKGRVSCRRTIKSKDYRAWIIPEEIAKRAGPEALKAALENGLADGRLAHSSDQ